MLEQAEHVYQRIESLVKSLDLKLEDDKEKAPRPRHVFGNRLVLFQCEVLCTYNGVLPNEMTATRGDIINVYGMEGPHYLCELKGRDGKFPIGLSKKIAGSEAGVPQDVIRREEAKAYKPGEQALTPNYGSAQPMPPNYTSQSPIDRSRSFGGRGGGDSLGARNSGSAPASPAVGVRGGAAIGNSAASRPSALANSGSTAPAARTLAPLSGVSSSPALRSPATMTPAIAVGVAAPALVRPQPYSQTPAKPLPQPGAQRGESGVGRVRARLTNSVHAHAGYPAGFTANAPSTVGWGAPVGGVGVPDYDGPPAQAHPIMAQPSDFAAQVVMMCACDVLVMRRCCELTARCVCVCVQPVPSRSPVNGAAARSSPVLTRPVDTPVRCG
jgi:hypothetical protein